MPAMAKRYIQAFRLRFGVVVDYIYAVHGHAVHYVGLYALAVVDIIGIACSI